jgi:hypothetical protein
MTFEDIIENIYLFFLSQTWEDITFLLKPACLLAITVFLLAIIWALSKSSWLYWYVTEDAKDFKRGSPVPLQKKAQKKWRAIKKRIESEKEANWKLAVIEGEEIVEDLLIKIGYQGKDIKRRLEKATESQIPNLKDLFDAVEIYNSILADPDYKLTKEKAKETLSAFEEYLRHLQYL